MTEFKLEECYPVGEKSKCYRYSTISDKPLANRDELRFMFLGTEEQYLSHKEKILSHIREVLRRGMCAEFRVYVTTAEYDSRTVYPEYRILFPVRLNSWNREWNSLKKSRMHSRAISHVNEFRQRGIDAIFNKIGIDLEATKT